jgi:hypothetical protein
MILGTDCDMVINLHNLLMIWVKNAIMPVTAARRSMPTIMAAIGMWFRHKLRNSKMAGSIVGERCPSQ